MKRSKMSLMASMLVLAAAMAVTSCASTTANVPADQASTSNNFKEGVAGGTVVNTVTKNAVVVSIDKKKREVVLAGADKKQFTVTVGPEAVNFDKIAKGDNVSITATEELVVAVVDKSVKTESGEVVKVTPKGGKPGGVAVKTVQVTATIVSIDMKNRTATLTFPDGTTKVTPVRNDVDLTKYKKGDKVVFKVTQMVAIDIVKK